MQFATRIHVELPSILHSFCSVNDLFSPQKNKYRQLSRWRHDEPLMGSKLKAKLCRYWCQPSVGGIVKSDSPQPAHPTNLGLISARVKNRDRKPRQLTRLVDLGACRYASRPRRWSSVRCIRGRVFHRRRVRSQEHELELVRAAFISKGERW
jgi:hypothetical protein